MARSLNKVILIGNVGASPEIRTTASGVKVARVSLATSYKPKHGDERTEWHRLTVWDRLAEVVEQYVRKGDRLYVEGEIRYSQSEHDGQTRYYTDIHVRELIMLGGEKREAAREAERAPVGSPFEDSDSDLPF